MSEFDDLVDELEQLGVGRGVHDAYLPDRLGPLLRRLSGVSGEDELPEVRRKVVALLMDTMDGLPPELFAAFWWVCGFDPEAPRSTPARVSHHAAAEHVSATTVYRRSAMVVGRLAMLLLYPQDERAAELAASRSSAMPEVPLDVRARWMLDRAEHLYNGGPGERPREQWVSEVAHLRQTGTGLAVLALLDELRGRGADGI